MDRRSALAALTAGTLGLGHRVGDSLAADGMSIINVRDEPFGARGDGTHDDAPAIQRAIAAAASGSGIIYFPRGRYAITSTIRLTSGLRLIGGPEAVLSAAGADDLILIQSEGAKDIQLEGLRFEGGGNWSEAPTEGMGGTSIGFTNRRYGFQAAGGHQIRITDCTFDGFGAYGILLGYTSQSQIDRCTLLNCGTGGVALYGATDCSVTRCTIRGIQGNQAELLSESKFADGIYLHYAERCRVEGNDIHDVRRIGIVLEGEPSEARYSYGCTVRGNRCTLARGNRGTEYNAGIWCENATDNTITENEVSDCGHFGIMISARGPHRVTGNIIIGTRPGRESDSGNPVRVGIALNSEDLNLGVVADNHISGCIRHGIEGYRFPVGSSCTIRGNHIVRNGGAGVWLEDCRGSVTLDSNLLDGNGMVDAEPTRRAGVVFNRLYHDGLHTISGNTFLAATEGRLQEFPIVHILGGEAEAGEPLVVAGNRILGDWQGTEPAILVDQTDGTFHRVPIPAGNGNTMVTTLPVRAR